MTDATHGDARPRPKTASDAKLAWSSDASIQKPAETPTRTEAASGPPPSSGTAAPVRVRLERQGRGGKVVTVVEGLPGHPARIEEIAKTLKSKCGAGGTVKGRVVEVQGDHRDRVVEALASLKIAARRAGG